MHAEYQWLIRLASYIFLFAFIFHQQFSYCSTVHPDMIPVIVMLVDDREQANFHFSPVSSCMNLQIWAIVQYSTTDLQQHVMSQKEDLPPAFRT